MTCSLDFQSNNRKYLTHVTRVSAVVREYERFKVAVMRVIPSRDDQDTLTCLRQAYRTLAAVDPFDMAERQHWTEGMRTTTIALTASPEVLRGQRGPH